MVNGDLTANSAGLGPGSAPLRGLSGMTGLRVAGLRPRM
jgi:hypothetical protein